MQTEKNQTRMTNQRLKILEYLKGVKTHPTAETVYDAVKKDLPAISLATVYRNLNFLAEQGVILKFTIDGEFRFDADMCSHQHAVCMKCGKVLDIMRPETSEHALNNFKHKDFTPECVRIIFKGRCKKCR